MSLPAYLRDVQAEVEGYARGYGLDFFPTIFEVLGYKQMNEVAAYGGFPTRYPHWRFGMDYEGLSKGYEYGLQKIYEMVINNNPSYAYLLEGNSLVDQKTVMAHVFAHVDFFKNNYFFSKTNRKMIDGMANHATRVRKHIERQGIDKIESFIDTCLSLENLIDPMSEFIVRKSAPRVEGAEEATEEVPKLRAKNYMDKFINPPEFVERQKEKQKKEKEKVKRVPEEPQRDVLAFLIEAAPLERWERDIIEIVREEAYYFAPQGQTKVLNEGWACVARNTHVLTNRGLLRMGDVVDGRASHVADGSGVKRVYDRNVIRNHETITVRTKRGLELCGSNNHRLLGADGQSWKRLDELVVGDRLAVTGGQNVWPDELVTLSWQPLSSRVSLEDVAREASVSIDTVLRYRSGARVQSGVAIAAAMQAYDAPSNLVRPGKARKTVRIPKRVDEHLASFLGYLVGDGHVSRVKRNLGLTTADEPQVVEFAQLSSELFGVTCSMRQDGGRWRVLLHSETISDFLVEALGVTTGPSARLKRVPDAVLRSPKTVVRAFLRSYFDCDGYAGPAGVILSTTSSDLAEQVQLLLLNFGILSHRRLSKADLCWQVQVRGASAVRFAESVGFGLARKQGALADYIRSHRWYKKETWDDEVVSLEPGRADVYDISVEETHRYAAGGFINHNSYWHSRIMTEKALKASEIIDYADANAGILATSPGQLNPYKLGVELLRHIEDRWNRGRFGKEWNDCEDMASKKNWDRRLGLGRQKIFEVRKLYNDVTFIDEFFTLEFCHDQRFYAFGFNERSGNWEIDTREFKKVKDKLLFQMTNHGQPFIYVDDGNFDNRGELLLRHNHEGVDLKIDHARDTLMNLHRVWKRPVNLLTKVDSKGKLMRFDGRDHSEKSAEYPGGK